MNCFRALFPCGDAMVCIIDDREDVWHYSPNLVHVKPYRFFQGTADINAPPGLTKTEQDGEPLIHTVRKVSQSGTSSTNEPGEKTLNRTEDNGEDTDTSSKIANKFENDPSTDHINQKNTNKSSMEMEHVDEKQVETEHVQSEDRRNSENEMDIEEHKFSEVEQTDKSNDLTSEEMIKDVQSEDRREPTNEMDNEEIKSSAAENRDKCADSTSHEIVNTAEIIERCDKAASIMETYEEVPIKVTDVDSKNEEVIDSHYESGKPRDESDETKQEEHKSNEVGSKEKTGSKTETNERKEEGGEGTKDTNEEGEDMIEWDDEDDYLLYLEEILKNIHSAFYLFYDELNIKIDEDKEGKEKIEEPSLKNLNDIEDKESKENVEKPSLKNLIPYIKKKVLKGCNIMFSGVIPTNMSPDKSRACIVARALGANVHTEFKTKLNENDPLEYTTHLVATRGGTSKARTAMKFKSMKKVTPDWLWSCSERWERVEEMLFPVPLATESDDQGRESPDVIKMKNSNISKRKRDPESGKETDESDTKRFKKVNSSNTLDTSSIEDDDENVPPVDSSSSKTKQTGSGDGPKTRSFSMSYNPMLAFSDDDLAYMDKEVEDEMDDEDASSEEEEVRDNRMRQQVLKSKHYLNDSSSEDSLCGDRPRGWGLKNKMSPKSSSDDEVKVSSSPNHEISPEYESETDQDKFDQIMEAFGPDSENSDDEYAESIGSVDEEIADAVMKEFLS